MTRINVVAPSELSREHLIAEYRGLPRVFGLIRAAIARGEYPNDPRNPRTYVLGKGHVRFFYNKINWLAFRHDLLVMEMRNRGYSANFPRAPLHGLPFKNSWNQLYTPTQADIDLNRERIAIRTEESFVRQRLKNKA